MSTATQPRTVAEKVAEAIADRDEVFKGLDEADRTGWDRKVIAQAIDWFAETARPFSANDLRELLPDVRPGLIGRQFRALADEGRIRAVGMTPSSKKSTRGHRVLVWIGVPK
jgi:hypothetical protein